MTAVALFGLFGSAGAFIENPDTSNGLWVVNGICLAAAWWRHTKAGFKAWRMTQDSTVMPSEPRPDRLTLALWTVGLPLLLADLVA
jgi:hypothetical protein